MTWCLRTSDVPLYEDTVWHHQAKMCQLEKCNLQTPFRVHIPCGIAFRWMPEDAGDNIDGLMQERRNSIVNALELRLYCINPSICHHTLREWLGAFRRQAFTRYFTPYVRRLWSIQLPYIWVSKLTSSYEWCHREHHVSRVCSTAQTWWRHEMETFSVLLALCVTGIHRSPVDSPHKDQWRRALMFSFICAWTHSWGNNLDAGDLRYTRAHYDVTVMKCWYIGSGWWSGTPLKFN